MTGSAQLVGTYVELYVFPDLDDFPGTDWLNRHAAPQVAKILHQISAAGHAVARSSIRHEKIRGSTGVRY
jgi:hypothetical protein